MRKVRDFNSELKALELKTRSLRQRKLLHLGELVIATGADALDMDVLVGGLLAMVDATNSDVKEGWRQRGAAFFRGRPRRQTRAAGGDDGRAAPNGGAAASDRSEAGAA